MGLNHTSVSSAEEAGRSRLATEMFHRPPNALTPALPTPKGKPGGVGHTSPVLGLLQFQKAFFHL